MNKNNHKFLQNSYILLVLEMVHRMKWIHRRHHGVWMHPEGNAAIALNKKTSLKLNNTTHIIQTEP